MSGRNQCYALPELQQWESAQVQNYVWGQPDTVDGLGKGMDTAGNDLTAVADSLKGVDVSGFWTGPAAEAFSGLRDRVEPAVRGLGSMHKDAGAALSTWRSHLAVYQEDAGTAITTGRAGWHLYQTTSCDNADAQAKMNSGKSGLTSAMGSRDSAGRTCKTALEAAVAKADVRTTPPASTQPTQPISTRDGERGTAPSGQEPIPAPPPYAAGLYVDPANGRLVTPRPGPWAIGRQPWVYTDGAQTNPLVMPTTAAPTTAAPTTAAPALTDVGRSPSGREPVPMIGPIAPGRERPYIDPANGRVVIPAQGPYLPGQRPWVYQR